MKAEYGERIARDLRTRLRASATVVFALMIVSCSADDGASNNTAPDAAIAPDASVAPSCTADRAFETCDDGTCTETLCRTDEWCVEAQCVPWRQADYSVGFRLASDATDPSIVGVVVDEGGFPREFVEALRFDFGDGISGWDESARHQYAEPGVYPVELEVRLADNRTFRATRLAEFSPDSDHNPLFLTVNDIPEILNGSVPARSDAGTPEPEDDLDEAFHLQVVRDRFTVDVVLTPTAADPVDLDTLELTADVPFGEVAAGEPLTDELVFDERGIRGRFSLRPELAPPTGMVTLTLQAQTDGGAPYQRTLTVEVVELTPELDPFDRAQIWLFRTDTDFFTTRREEGAGNQFVLVSTATPDGEPDFIQELTLMGALGDDPDLNAIYLQIIKDAIDLQIYRYFGIGEDGTPYDDIDLSIVWQGDDDAPSPADFSPQGDVSMMRFGGVFDGYLGFSIYAPYNQDRVDDSTVEYGVATAGILGTYTSSPVISDAFEPIHPDLGARLGDHPLDEVVLSPTFDPYTSTDADALARHADLMGVARYIGIGLAPIIAHEMGHAMGLMPDGLPPEGFFGNRPDISFIGAGRTNRHHTDFPGLNLMQAGGNFFDLVSRLNQIAEFSGGGLVRLAEVLSLETELSPLSRAYMQRRLTYGVTSP